VTLDADGAKKFPRSRGDGRPVVRAERLVPEELFLELYSLSGMAELAGLQTNAEFVRKRIADGEDQPSWELPSACSLPLISAHSDAKLVSVLAPFLAASKVAAQ